jgi:hypothetical protein
MLHLRGTSAGAVPVEAACAAPDRLAGLTVARSPCSGPLDLLPTFRYHCTDRLVFLELYLRQLRAWGFVVSPTVSAANSGATAAVWWRWAGVEYWSGKNSDAAQKSARRFW